MKFKEFCKVHKKKVIIVSLASVLVIVLAGGLIFYFSRSQNSGNGSFGQGGRISGMAQLGDMLAASGVTSVGINQVSFDVENLTEELEVEEVYVASNDELKEGDKVLKLTEESIAAVRVEVWHGFSPPQCTGGIVIAGIRCNNRKHFWFPASL